MAQHGVIGRLVAMLAVGSALVPALTGGAVRAETPALITNISAAVSGGTVSYSLCLLAPSTFPAAEGAVTLQSADGNKVIPLTPTSLTCGGATALMQGSVSGLPAGSYRFRSACVLLTSSATASAPVIPCLVRDVGLASNFEGATVATECQVDVDPTRTMPPQNCTGPGVVGDLTNPVSQPTPAPPTATPPISGTAPTTATATPLISGTVSPWFGPAVSDAFFAEGYTGAGYQEYVSLLNPGARVQHAHLTIYRLDGASRVVDLELEALSRRTLDMNALAPRASTALRVEGDGPLVVERALYHGNGHLVAGAPSPSRHWYVAAGDVGAGFADGLRVFNPNTEPAVVTITAYRSDGVARQSQRVVSGGVRLNVALDDLASHGAVALLLQSSAAVVVESVVLRPGASGPSAAMALPGPARAWYFPAGGQVSGGRVQLAVFNPAPVSATVHVRVVTPSGEQPGVTLHIRPHARASASALSRPPGAGPASLMLRADQPIVAQEVWYGAGGVSVTNGTLRPARSWGFAEGYAGAAFTESLSFLNPGTREALVRVQLIGRSGVVAVVTLHVHAHRSNALAVNGRVPRGPVAAVVAASQPIVAGRTLVFDGGKGLSTTIGVALPGH